MSDTSAVRMAKPPPAMLRVVNLVFRRCLTSRIADRMPPAMAVLQFTGRRSGRRFAVPVGVHATTVGTVVFTEAGWRANFAGGRELALRRGRRWRRGRGVLVTDPGDVATALADALERVGARNLAIRAAPGHQVTRADLLALNRGMVRVELD